MERTQDGATPDYYVLRFEDADDVYGFHSTPIEIPHEAGRIMVINARVPAQLSNKLGETRQGETRL